MPPILPSNVPAPLAQLSTLPPKQGGPRLQTSAVNPPPHISDFILQRDMLPLHYSYVRAAPPPLSISIQGRGHPPPPPSSVRAHATLLSALLPQ